MAAEAGEKTPNCTLPADDWENKVSLEEYTKKGSVVLAVSADPPWWHRAFAADQSIAIPLLADFDKRVIEDYGFRRETGFPERAYFVIDREGLVRARQVEPSPKDQPEVEAVLEDLDKAI